MSDVSIKEVAEIAGVSIATVSRCINSPEKVTDGTRRKVQDAIAQTGYSPNTLAQSFRRGRTNTIMVVLPSVGEPFFAAVMRGIRTAAKVAGYSIVIEETRFNTMTNEEVRAMLLSHQIDGIILLGAMPPFGTELLSAGNQRLVPIVVGCEKVSSELDDLPCVRVDSEAAATDAINYLIEQGHERIGMIRGDATSLITRDRERGYRSAMKQANLPVREEWIVEGKLSIPGARRASRTILACEEPPTAIFCANDDMAIGCLHEIKAAGLQVPRDVSVIGFDDIRYAEVTDPPLTTISQPAEEIGERVTDRLCRRIEGGSNGDAETQLLPHKLIIRQSVAPPDTQ